MDSVSHLSYNRPLKYYYIHKLKYYNIYKLFFLLIFIPKLVPPLFVCTTHRRAVPITIVLPVAICSVLATLLAFGWRSSFLVTPGRLASQCFICLFIPVTLGTLRNSWRKSSS